ncbi:translin [Panicum miliaceum]|uniref:Translin n=1 Tax=Panicum miliaceum TaxID=4540 RepID=A0A3L6S426_PANMI|nr:translin [Panicum miliaceum]
MGPAAAAATATATAAALRLSLAPQPPLSSPTAEPPSSSPLCAASAPPPLPAPPPPPTPSSRRACPPPVMDAQFESFRAQLDESSTLRDRIRTVVSEIESASRVATAALLLVHQPVPLEDVLGKEKAQVEVIKGLYAQLAEVLKECPGQYYRYHGDWRSETQAVVSMLAFMHWLETGGLLMHAEAQEKLGLSSGEFCLDVEDYLTGLCFMSNEFPRFVVNRVTAGDYDCPRKVLSFLTDLHASFRMLNLRNDFLRKKFDGMKYDLRRVEEVYYDVKIRGLAPAELKQEWRGQVVEPAAYLNLLCCTAARPKELGLLRMASREAGHATIPLFSFWRKKQKTDPTKMQVAPG